MPPPPRRSRPGAPQLVGELLAGVLSRNGLEAKLDAASILVEWESLVGPQISAVTTAQRVSEGVLFVAVANSAWMMELNLMKMELMRRVNAGKREGRIRQIVFVMANDPGGDRPGESPPGASGENGSGASGKHGHR